MGLKVLVTGADGFVGTALCPELAAAGHRVVRAVRGAGRDAAATAVGDIDAHTDWTPAMRGIEAVIHLAGRAHVMKESSDPTQIRAAYFATNADGTEALARAAAAEGARRFVFVSSIKVNGEFTTDRPFRETDAPRPQDDYGRSKLEAERRLAEVARATGLECVIVRPPLIHGPGVKGNLARLIRLVERGVPLPFGSIRNRRSLVGVGNVASALRACVEHPGAAGQTFLLSDGEDVSTGDLIRMIAIGLRRRPYLLPVPAPLLHAVAALTRSSALARLSGSLQVDGGEIMRRLGWVPPLPLTRGIEHMVRSAGGRRAA